MSGLSTNNTFTCFNGIVNFGKPDCEIFPEVKKGGLVAPFGVVIPASAVASPDAWKAYLLARLTDNDPNTRWQPINSWTGFEDKSKAPQIQDMQDGTTVFLDDGYKAWEYMYREGGLEHHNRLKQLNGKHKQYCLIDWDANNTVYLTKAGVDSNNLETYTGTELKLIHVYDVKDPTTGQVAEFRIRLDPVMGLQLTDDVRVVNAGFDMRKFVNASSTKEIDLDNRTASGGSSGVFRIAIKHGSVNLVKALGAGIANTNVIKARLADGTALPLTSVAPTADGEYATVTFNTSSPYVVGGDAEIYTPGPTTLAGLGTPIKYYGNNKPLKIKLT